MKVGKQVRVTSRYPEVTVEWLKKKAQAESRSFNGQMVYELEQVRKREQEAA